MPDQQPQTLRQIADAPKMRAATPTERVVDQVRNWYDWLATQPLVRVADALGVTDIAGIARDEFTNPERFKMGTMPDGPGTLKGLAKGPIKAYHGSPHDFDQFSLSKIGTGEGAQAYGHGLYMAEHPDVARGYRDMVPADKRGLGEPMDLDLRIGGKRIEDVYSQMDRSAARMSPAEASSHYDKLALLEDLGHEGDVLAIREKAKQGAYSPEAVAWFEKDVAPKFTRKGKLYEVRIHADPHDFLDWDAPLSQQPPTVKEAANDMFRGQLKTREIGPDLVDVHLYSNGAGSIGVFPKAKVQEVLANPADYLPFKGKQFYQQMESERAVDRGVWKSPGEYASQELHQLNGIPGIKYLDGASRGKGQGSRNYVVFDDKLIEIVKKYGIAGAVSAGLINQAQARQLQEQGY